MSPFLFPVGGVYWRWKWIGGREQAVEIGDDYLVGFAGAKVRCKMTTRLPFH